MLNQLLLVLIMMLNVLNTSYSHPLSMSLSLRHLKMQYNITMKYLKVSQVHSLPRTFKTTLTGLVLLVQIVV
jgi:hypothetical protein